MSFKSDVVSDAEVLGLSTSIVTAYLGSNPLAPEELPGLIREVHGTLSALSGDAPSATTLTADAPKPVMDPKKAVRSDAINCLVCGKPFAMLKRHLMTEHDLTPDQYRARYGLDRTYPIVAPDYAERRSLMAKDMGLGTVENRKRPSQAAGGKQRGNGQLPIAPARPKRYAGVAQR